MQVNRASRQAPRPACGRGRYDELQDGTDGRCRVAGIRGPVNGLVVRLRPGAVAGLVPGAPAEDDQVTNRVRDAQPGGYARRCGGEVAQSLIRRPEDGGIDRERNQRGGVIRRQPDPRSRGSPWHTGRTRSAGN